MTTAISLAILTAAWAIYHGLQEVAEAIRETRKVDQENP